MALRPEAIMGMENSIQNAATRRMMENSEGGNGDKKSLENVAFLSPKKMEEWNSFIEYAEKKGFAGKPEIDKGGKGNKLFEEWKKSNPNVSISMEDMPSVRKSYLALRNETIENFKSGKATYDTPQAKLSGPNADYSSFMRNITLNEESTDPNYIGQYLTRTKFPGAKTRIREQETKKILSEESAPLRMPGMTGEQMQQLYKKGMSKIPNKP